MHAHPLRERVKAGEARGISARLRASQFHDSGDFYTSKAYNFKMQYEFIESTLFTKMVHDYLSDEDYAAFQQFLLEHPEAGDVVRGSGGVRKVRWARAGAGKSGGVRVCYYTRNQRGQILLLVIYAKSVRASIPGALLKQIKEVLDHDD